MDNILYKKKDCKRVIHDSVLPNYGATDLDSVLPNYSIRLLILTLTKNESIHSRDRSQHDK
jgi:hypothetical protein